MQRKLKLRHGKMGEIQQGQMKGGSGMKREGDKKEGRDVEETRRAGESESDGEAESRDCGGRRKVPPKYILLSHLLYALYQQSLSLNGRCCQIKDCWNK